MSKALPIIVDAPVLRAVGSPMEMMEITVMPPGPQEVRIQMAASGVCHSCLHIADGTHIGGPVPMILGDEGAGIVESVGDGVTRVKPGDHVIVSWAPACGYCVMCAAGRPVLCRTLSGSKPGFLPGGEPRFFAGDEVVHHFGPSTYAPYTVVHESQAIPVDKAVPLDIAALIGCAVTTGVGAVLNTAACRPGMSVAVFGCGGVGLSAIQGAQLGGAHPITAIDIEPGRLQRALQLGATTTVVANAPDALEQLREISGGGFDITILAVGSTVAFSSAWAATGVGGTFVVVGKPTEGATVDFDPGSLLAGERRILGSSYGSSRPSIDFPKLANLYLAGRLPLDTMLGTRFTPDEANEAFVDLLSGKPGRGIIEFSH